jgi:hypothetical protein
MPTMSAHTGKRHRLPMLGARLRATVEGAPAFRRFTAALATGYHPDGSAPERGFLKARRNEVFCPFAASRLELSTLRGDRSFCRPTGAPRPPEERIAFIRARAPHPAPLSESALAKGTLGERDFVLYPKRGPLSITETILVTSIERRIRRCHSLLHIDSLGVFVAID